MDLVEHGLALNARLIQPAACAQRRLHETKKGGLISPPSKAINAAPQIWADLVQDAPLADRATCLEVWRQVFDAPPPKRLSVGFLRKAILHEQQCQKHGRVPKQTLRRLQVMASGKMPNTCSTSSLKPGAHLMREWNGRTYQVEVVTQGFVMDGLTYKSLSAIAKRITGAHWSGPRFFGLTQ
ncbi:DUF2924 domain-containing protein [Falsihalocynthiibacter arcticus]|uniref:DUF2924 domain-containing protein n=1 Tax=Falsihalocynthiibacter arcticus TaxID=1579316 RepID=UPI0030025F90